MSYRTYPETGELWVSTGTASMQMSYTVDGTRTITISRDYSFLPDQGSTNLDMSMDFQQTLLAGTVNFDVGNDLDSYLFWESDWGISTDPISQSGYEWNFRSFSFYTDVMLDFLGTEYVNLFISDIDYGDDSTPQFDLCNVVYDDCIDNIKDKDVIAGVFGDFTGVGDMPSSGSQTYNVKAIAFWHPNKLESLSSIPHWPSYEGDAKFTLTGSPSGRQLQIDLGANFAAAKVKLLATITRSIANEKTKALVTGQTATVNTEALATEKVIGLRERDEAINMLSLIPI